MPRMKISFVYRIVGGFRHGIWIVLQRPPEVCQQPISIIDGFDRPSAVGAKQKYGGASAEWLDIIRNVTQCGPDQIRDRGLPAKPGKWRPMNVIHFTTSSNS